jgi:hypothetical protein
MWGWLGGDYIDAPNSRQLTWFAENYGVVVIGGANPGPGHNLSYPGQFDLAAALKKTNPEVKVLLYEASGFGALGFGQQEMRAHPEWCLTDDAGVPYNTFRNGKDCGCKEIDYRKREVRDWFVHTANQSGKARGLFDGLMIDSAGAGSSVQYRADNHTMSDATIKVVMQAKMDMLGEATSWFKLLNDGYVTGNPTLEWDVIGPNGGGRGGPFPDTYVTNPVPLFPPFRFSFMVHVFMLLGILLYLQVPLELPARHPGRNVRGVRNPRQHWGVERHADATVL